MLRGAAAAANVQGAAAVVANCCCCRCCWQLLGRQRQSKHNESSKPPGGSNRINKHSSSNTTQCRAAKHLRGFSFGTGVLHARLILMAHITEAAAAASSAATTDTAVAAPAPSKEGTRNSGSRRCSDGGEQQTFDYKEYNMQPNHGLRQQLPLPETKMKQQNSSK